MTVTIDENISINLIIMKKIIFTIVVLLLIIPALYIFTSQKPSGTVTLTDMPWQIEIGPEGNSRVFGIELGKTTLNDLRASWKQFFPEIGLFSDREQQQRLEAYLGNRRLGRFDAKVILGLETSAEQLKLFSADQINFKPMRSGDYKQEITEKHQLEAYQLPIQSITYLPKVKYDATLLDRYFSTPSEKITLGDSEAAFWLYPDKGLAVLLDPKGKEVFHYVNPERFSDLLKHLKLETGQ